MARPVDVEYMSIKDITPQTRRHWTAKVRVLEKSFPRTPSTDAKKYQRLILADAELLHQYEISNANVTPVDVKHQIVPHDYQWTINRRTPVTELKSEKENEIAISLNLVRFSDLHKYINAQAEVDVMAMVVASLPQKEVETRHGDYTVQEFVVLNEELKPTILTMWDQFVSNEANYIVHHLNEWPIILAMRLKVGSYNALSLSTKSSTTFLMDPNLPEATTMRSWGTQNRQIIKQIVDTKQYLSASSTSISDSTGEISKIKDIPTTPYKGQTFKVHAYASIVNKEQKFLYMCCNKCQKSIDAKYKSTFTCNYCNKLATATPRCCIEIQLQDSSGQIKATIFGQEAENLFSITAIKLQETKKEDDRVDVECLEATSNDKEHIFLLKACQHEYRKQKIVKFVVVSVYGATNNDRV